MKQLLVLVLALGLSNAAAAGGTDEGEAHRPSIITVDCPGTACCEDDCKPGRLVGASLGLVGSAAAMAVGAAFTARGFNQDRVDDSLRRAQRGWGVGLIVAGTGGLISSAIAIKRNKDERREAECPAGVFCRRCK